MGAKKLTLRDNPCHSCPYRRDVPSGVWATEEYDKLLPYDADTASQPSATVTTSSHCGSLS